MKHLLYRLLLLTLTLALPLASWAQAPTLTGFAPGSGPLDASVTVTGTNLANATSLLVGSVPARLTGQSATQVTFAVPRQAVGQRLRVSTPSGTALSAAAFAVTRPSTSPVFAGGASLTTDGTTVLAAGAFAVPTVTDVDGDGRLDLLVGNQTGNVQRFEQTAANGSVFADLGLLTTDGATALAAGIDAAPTVTDVDGDGLLDLLVGNNGGNVQRYEQTAANGSAFADLGLLTTNGTTALDAGGFAAPTVTDVDGDGRLDLLVGNQTGNVQRFEQTAANGNVFALVGNLTTDGTTVLDAGTLATPVVTDMDGDGLLDLLVGNSIGNVQRYEQTAANGSVFASVGNLTTDGTTVLVAGSFVAPTVTDVDGDGRLDLLVSNQSGNVQRYEQPAPPTAPTLTGLSPGSGAAGTVVTLTGTDLAGATAVTFAGPATGTFTVVNATTITVTVPAGATTGNVSVTTPLGTSNGLPFTVVPTISGFAPGSGPLEASVTVTGTNLAGLTSLLVGAVPARPTGQSATQVTFNVPRQAVGQRLRVSTPDGTALSAATFAVTRPSTSPVFAGGANLTTDGTTALDAGTLASPAVTDVDGDGRLDLLVGNQTGNVQRFEQTAANGSAFADLGLLTTNGTTALGVGSLALPAVTDMDGDGRLDLLVGDGNGNVRRYEQTAANGGVFADLGPLTTDGTTALDAGIDAAPTVTDVDGDGLLDLLVGNNGGNVQRYEQTAANGGVFADLGLLTTDGTTALDAGVDAAPTVTDVDGNGLLDLLVGNQTGNVQRFEQTAANGSVFASVGNLTTNGTTALDAGNFAAPAVTDVDGDGLLDLLVGNQNGNVQRYEQTASPQPVLTGLSPGSGAAGTLVTLTGTGLSGATAVTFAGPAAGTFTVVNATTITVTVPAGASTGNVSVTTPAGTSNGLPFTVTVPPPTLTGFAPGSGPLEASVTVTGTNLANATSLLVGSVPARLTGQSATQVTFNVPRQAVGQRLRVSTPSGTALSAAAFAVTRPSTSAVFAGGANLTTNGTTALAAGAFAVPTVTDVDGDGLLDLLVGNFDGNVRRFEQTAANGSVFASLGLLTTDGTTSLDAGVLATPAVTDVDGDGRLDLLVGDGSGNVRRFEQTATNGNVFADLGLLTTNGTTALDANGGAAPTVTDVDGDGLLDLLVGNLSGNVRRFEQTAANGNVFADLGLLTTNGTTALAVGVDATPTVTDVDGNGRLDLLVGNSGNVQRFEQTAANGGVFADLGLLTTNGTTALAAGAHAAPVVTDVDGDGLLDLLVGNSIGNVQRYEQLAPPLPTLTSLSPGSGAAGTLVTLTGTNLSGATAVTFAGPATGTFTVASATTITVTVPAGASTGNVTVTTPAGTSNGLPFTVVLPPTLTGFTPGSGPLGTTLTLTGANLTGLRSVLVGGVPAAFAVQSATQATATVPRQAVSQRVRVNSANGTALSAAAFQVTRPSSSTVLPALGNLTTNGTTALDVGSATAPTVTDVDGNGLLDLLVGNYDGNVQRYEQTAANGAVFALVGSLTTNGTSVLNAGLYATPTVTDVDGDGLLDLLVGNINGNVRRYEQTTANGTVFAFVGNLTTDGTLVLDAGSATTPTVTDVDGNGLLDLLVGNVSGNVRRYEQTAANGGVFADLGLLTTDGTTALDAGSAAAPTVTDMDGDGLLDLLVGNQAGTVQRYEQTTANGAVFAFVGNPTTDGTTTLSAGIAAAPTVTDVDGDGLLDLLVGNQDGNVQRYEQAAPPTAPTLTSLSPGSGAAGTVVTLTGTNLNGATAVTFAGPATGTFTVVNATTITVTVPAGATTGNVTVTTPAGTSNGLAFTVYPDLVVSTSGQTIAAGTYHSITVTGTGTGTLAGPVTVTATTTVQSGGVLNDGCAILSGPGSFTLAAGGTLGICAAAGISSSGSTGSIQVTGTRSFSTDALYTYNGSAAQVTGSGLPATVRTLTLSNSAGLTLTDDVTATSAATLTGGVLRTGSNALTLGSAATLAEDVDGYATGTVQTTRTLNTAGTTQSFGGLGLTLTPSGSRLPGSTLVVRTTGTARTGAGTSQSVKRVFDIQPTVRTGLNVALQLTVRDDERNGIPVANLRLFKSDNAGSTWQPQAAATFATAAASGSQPTTYTASLAGISSFSLWTLGNAANPLPVELAAFTAQAQGTGALLRWTTASEVNNAGFEVESSADGARFARLGTVAGAGSSAQAHTYAFTDEHVARYAAPQVYYRLRQVDLDGTFTYSPVRTVAVDGPAGLALFPNPTTQAATLTGVVPGTVITVFDALGRPVTTATADASGMAHLALPAGLAPGVYVVRAGRQALHLAVE